MLWYLSRIEKSSRLWRFQFAEDTACCLKLVTPHTPSLASRLVSPEHGSMDSTLQQPHAGLHIILRKHDMLSTSSTGCHTDVNGWVCLPAILEAWLTQSSRSSISRLVSETSHRQDAVPRFLDYRVFLSQFTLHRAHYNSWNEQRGSSRRCYRHCKESKTSLEKADLFWRQQFKYSINNTVVYSPPTVSCESWCESVFYDQYPDIHSFFFTVHYLSICSGFMGGSATAAYTLLECQNRKLGWTFHTHDPYIVNFGAANGSRPVSMDDVKAVKIETATPAATMVVGLTCSILAVIMYFIDLYGLGRHWQVDIPTGTAALMGVSFLPCPSTSAINANRMDQGRCDISHALVCIDYQRVAQGPVAFRWSWSL